MISCWMRTVWKDESRFVEAFGMGKELSEMTLEELWELSGFVWGNDSPPRIHLFQMKERQLTESLNFNFPTR